MNGAWIKGAAAVDFNGIKQAQFLADITAAAADDAEIGDLEADLKMKREVRDDKYVALNDKRSKVGLGVAGSAAYGNDSPLYGAGGLRPQIRPRLRHDPKSKTARDIGKECSGQNRELQRPGH